MVLLTAAVLLLGWEVRRVLTWIVVAALLAIILGPLVDIVQRRLHLRRALATLLVFLVALIALAGILTMFIRPLASEGPSSSTGSPATSSRPAPGEARSGIWSSASTWTSTSSATRRGSARAPTASPPQL
jgi:predicted PurR-regulated permease PerM